MTQAYRQGDVLIIPINEEGSGALALQPKLVLALGEVTGHSHRFEGVRAHMSGTPASNKGAVLTLESPSTLIHEEHAPITIPGGVYKVLIQREYDPRKDTSYVAD